MADVRATTSTRPTPPRASRGGRRPRPAPPRPGRAPAAPSGDVWWRLALCESGGNQRAYNPAGPFYSYFQWMLGTWRSVGGQGDPRDASYEEQVVRAQTLQRRSGWGQWPHCARKLGLR